MTNELRVLIVDDSADDSELLLRELREGGYSLVSERVDTADMMRLALDKHAWDLVIADYSMPTFSGLAALELLKERETDVPFILVSGKVGEETAVLAMRAGANDILMKDKLSRMVPAVQRELRDAESRRARKQAELEVRRSRDQLEQRVRERTAELAKAMHAADAANRAKSQFLTVMSHELLTPLNGLMGMTELLLGTDLSAKQRQYVDLAKSSGEVLLDLIHEVLDLSQMEAESLNLDKAAFDLHEAIKDVTAGTIEKAQAKGLMLNLVLQQELPRDVNGDYRRFQQILRNILSNAIKFTKRGGVDVHATLDEETDRAVVARLTICDTGIGIPQDRLDHLFASFSQVDTSMTRQNSGAGLGLAICKRIVESMNGQIGVVSREAYGSTFWFTVRLEKTLTGDSAGATQTSQLTDSHTAVEFKERLLDEPANSVTTMG